jgi:shikimate dehydrogenase
MKLFGLIGFPLSHSFSKQYFLDKFQREKIEGCNFENFELARMDEVKKMIETHPDLEGFAITIPYKKKIIHYLYDATEEVKQMVACNCVQIKDGKLFGHNTDIIGFEKSLREHLLPRHSKALILGTGGAAHAVEFVFKKLGIDFLFVSREKIGRKDTIRYEQINENIMAQHTLIIHTTPLGTFPKVDECPAIPYSLITPQHYLFDLVYNPEKTLFLSRGEQQGATIKNGYDMLVIQAEENWKIWNS